MSDRVAILGAGKMGEALLSGMVRAGRPTSDLVVTTHESGRADTLRERYGVEISDNTTAVKSARTVVIAVKPQDMGALLDEIATLLTVVGRGLPHQVRGGKQDECPFVTIR